MLRLAADFNRAREGIAGVALLAEVMTSILTGEPSGFSNAWPGTTALPSSSVVTDVRAGPRDDLSGVSSRYQPSDRGTSFAATLKTFPDFATGKVALS